MSGDDYIFEANGITITVKDGADKIIKVIDVNGDERLFGKYLTLDDNDPATVTAPDGVATIDAVFRTKDIVINGNSGGNTIISSSGDCTLYGGDGNDTFVRGSRTAEQTITIADYTEGEDVIYHSRPFSTFSLLDGTKSVGDDYISEAGAATFIYTGGADKKIKFVDVNGDVAYFGNYITILNVDSDTIEATEKVKVLDATKRTKAIEIVGNDLDNTIISGKGNVTLTGGDGADLFVYSAGKDVITDYTTDDKISLGAAITSTSLNGSDVVFKIADGSLTVKDAKDKPLNLIDSSGVGNATVISVDTTQVFTDLVSDVTTQASKVDRVAANATGTKDITMSGGAAAIIGKTSAGKDTIISQGDNVNVSLTGGNTRIFSLEGRMTVENYDAATGSGFGTTYENIFTPIEGGSIDFKNGYLNLHSAQVYMGNSSELMNFYSIAGKQQKVGYASSRDSLDASNEIKNLILVANPGGTITGGSGNDTIFANEGSFVDGGAGHDKMFGNTDADKKVATFYYMPSDGRDSIENFDFMSDAQDVTADKVKLDDNSAITDVFLRGDDVGIRIDGGKEFVMLEGAQGKSFRVNDDLIAKVDTNVEFDGYMNCYVGIGARASLTVGKGAGNVEVWLSDDSLEYHGTIYDGNFAILDASQSDGNNILAGNELSNVIMGGSGANSIWGGYGSESDTLIGGTGQNTFFYGMGNGNDNIQNAHDGDTISLEDITLDQIADANITTGGVIFKFTDGGSLTVDGTADVTYQLADGTKYSANHSTHDWDSK